MTRAGIAFLVALALTGCATDSSPEIEQTNAVLYTIGFSTDPYGNSTPGGFGVVTGLEDGNLSKVEVRQARLGGFGGAEWLDAGRIVVPRPGPPLRPPLIFRHDGELKAQGAAPVPGGAAYAWSPGMELFAYEPAVPCKKRQRSLYGCYRASGELFVTRVDGSEKREVAKGHLQGWTVDGRIAFFKSYQRATPQAFDLGTGKTGPVLPGWKVEPPIWSPDRRFVAAVTGGGVVVAGADGRMVQVIRSKFVISMVAWAPVGRRLAFTTSGFPDPHELFVLERPDARPRLLYKTGAMHFDWITWSPDGRRLLLDEEHMNRWLLLRADRSRARRSLPRLGGKPLWCCPVNAFSALGTTRQ